MVCLLVAWLDYRLSCAPPRAAAASYSAWDIRLIAALEAFARAIVSSELTVCQYLAEAASSATRASPAAISVSTDASLSRSAPSCVAAPNTLLLCTTLLTSSCSMALKTLRILSRVAIASCVARVESVIGLVFLLPASQACVVDAPIRSAADYGVGDGGCGSD